MTPPPPSAGSKSTSDTCFGDHHDGRLALLQVIARVIDQGSRLSAVRFATRHAVCEILGIKKLDEEDLCENLAWLAKEQENVEKRLFAQRFSRDKPPPTLFLYDVTSTYLEGTCNAFATWGYNRDKKNGKKQIVIGLLAGPDGLPVAVRVFKGNTSDPTTVTEQVRILAKQFGVKDVTLVGDRGMLKGAQIEALPDDFRTITAISKPQIRKMLAEGVLQYELFTDEVCEVEQNGVRYVLRRNPIRAQQIATTREEKFNSILRFVDVKTKYLAEHPRADPAIALKSVCVKIGKLKASKWLTATQDNRTICVEKCDVARSQEALLDGCYVVKSDVPKDSASAQTLHDRYCDLEMAFARLSHGQDHPPRASPCIRNKKCSTQGHIFIVMLALLLQRELEQSWSALDVSVAEGIDELSGIHMLELELGEATVHDIPKPTKLGQKLLDAANIILPSVLPKIAASVHTKKKLDSERKQRNYK